jgi:uncharacterized protein YgbK (DUF1537 family)
MLAVIADDLTGAAELAGIGLRYQLSVELITPGAKSTGADLLVVSTDSRSMNLKEAEKITVDTVRQVQELGPEFIYKKIDSVLRGHILDELKIEMKLLGLSKALIIPANPSLGRTIKNGKYFINGDSISETDFVTDPEFAINDSSVLKMIKDEAGDVVLLKHTDTLPNKGIVIGEAVSDEDVAAWSAKIDSSWLLVGAGDFFTALLDRRHISRAQPEILMESPHLYVSGTAFGKSQELIKKIERELQCVAYIPASMIQTGSIKSDRWFDTLKGIIEKQGKAVVAINDEEVDPWSVSPVHLRVTMAKAIKKILEQGNVKELFIEGGSTAAAILAELGINRLLLVNELQRGVVRMKAKDIYITVKPGSYSLPEQIKELYLLT